ncbi:hypothetical protein B0J11DRAFT_113022 [Dendryphion nanum]|uniref:Carbohydrate esterase family 16 protein n=1 Tax=Dendryphion nanum TaxID=256645 RepID=A0A9P9IDK8_9PLEO|nr:hypothetical protein B0J11DRAFT_113022 [Dendryphion nanum]
MYRLFISILLAAQTYAQIPATEWPGWDEISTIFVFGDSYSTTGFELNGTQPNAANPLGNPALPGRTFSNGRNWINLLTSNYNDSFVRTYNFARAGASLDSFGQPSPFRPFDIQVDQFFLPNYALNNTNLTRWKPENTLFISFFGINDVNFFYKLSNATTYATMLMNTYDRYTERLYRAGARNFLFMNVPAIHRAPFTVNQGANSTRFIEQNRVAVEDFNDRITDMARRFDQRHRDATIFLFDTFSLFNAVMDNPRSRPETIGYTNTTGFCAAYSRRTYNEEESNSSCGAPQKEFLWLDALHPTTPIHTAMASEVAAQLRGNEIIGRPNAPPRSGASSRNTKTNLTTSLAVLLFSILAARSL